MDPFEFLASDTAVILSIALIAYIIMWIGKGGHDDWQWLFPISIVFLKPVWEMIVGLAFYGAVLWLVLPFVVGLGFPFVYSVIIGLTLAFKKAFKCSLEYGLALSLLVVAFIGSGA